MSRRSLRIATTRQLFDSVRAAGFDAYLLPESVNVDFNRSLDQRLADGAVYEPFLEENEIDLILDHNTGALTLLPLPDTPGGVALTSAKLGIPHVACYLDPVTSTMAQVRWEDHWQLLEHQGWIKWIWESAHSEELSRLGVSNVLTLPMAAADQRFPDGPARDPQPSPVIAFMGHPASSWFAKGPPVKPSQLYAGLLAAAVRTDMPDLPFHKIYFDLYELGELPLPSDDPPTRAAKSSRYFADKFAYNAFLALQQRDRWVRFLQTKLKDQFELIGDHWGDTYGLKHTPRIWDMKVLHERMRDVPICLNLIKGNVETGLIIRHFEITSHGGFLLTYPTEELEQCFEIGKECEVFHSEADLLEKIRFYTEHPKERYEIAAAGQRRTLSQHLYSHRITRLVEVLREAGVLPRTLTQPTHDREGAETTNPNRDREGAETQGLIAGEATVS
jgi:hypothetical protein